MSVISTIANYGGKIANNSVDIKQFIVSPIASTVQWLLKSIDATLTKYITPYSNSPVYINNLKANTITAQDITVYNFYNLSDVSLKENICDIDEGEYDKILYLMPAKYNFKNDDSKKIHFGFIAQELEEFFLNDTKLKDAFYSLTPGRQRGYILSFSQPKQSVSRKNRIEKYRQQIIDGIGLNDKYK